MSSAQQQLGVAETAKSPDMRSTRSTTFTGGEGNQLRAERLAVGLSLRQFADRLAVSLACASRWETDVRRPHSSDIPRIAAVIGRPVEEVRGWFAAPLLTTETLRYARGMRRLRLRARLSRAELGEAVGVASATVAHWECGRRALPAHRLEALAVALDVDVAEFVSTALAAAPPPPSTALAAMRKHSGLTQKQLAKRLGVSSGMVSRWERGEGGPNWPNTRKLAKVLPFPLAEVASAVGRRPPVELDSSRWRTGAIGPVLRELRIWRGETQATIALRVGVNLQTLRRWETGSTRPTESQARRLEVALGLPAGSLPC